MNQGRTYQARIYRKHKKLCGCCGVYTLEKRRYCSSRHHTDGPVYINRFCCPSCTPIHYSYGYYCCLKCVAKEKAMSTDWHVHCKDCNSNHPFNDANHQDGLMHGLVRHKRLIASLLPLLEDKDITSDVEFKTYYGHIDVKWFAEHVEHNLVVQNEYGDIREVTCDLCKQPKDVRRISLGSPASTVGFYCEECNNRIKDIVRGL